MIEKWQRRREGSGLPAIFLSGFIHYLGASCPAGFPFALLITVNPAASTAVPVSFSWLPRPISISSQLMSDVLWEVLLKRKFMMKVSPAFNPSAYQGAPEECQVWPTCALLCSHCCYDKGLTALDKFK